MTTIQKAIIIATNYAEKDNYGRQVVRIDKLIPELTALLTEEKKQVQDAFFVGKGNQKNFDDYLKELTEI